MTPITIGIDCGRTGAAAVICGRRLLEVTGWRPKDDIGAIVARLVRTHGVTSAGVESTYPGKKQGKASLMAFAQSRGEAIGAMHALGVMHVDLAAVKWRRVLGASGRAEDLARLIRCDVMGIGCPGWSEAMPGLLDDVPDHEVTEHEAEAIGIAVAVSRGIR